LTSLALLIDQLFSPAPGGIGSYIRELVPALSRADPSLDIVLFHSRFETTEPPERWPRQYPVEELPGSIGRLYPRWALIQRPALPPSLSTRDLVHSPNTNAVPPKGPSQRSVVTVHDLSFLQHPELFPWKWRVMYRAGLERAIRSADALIAISRHTAEDLARRRRVDPGKIHVVPLAASVPATDTEVDAVLTRLKVRQPYVLHVGTLEPRKNLVRLVRAYRRLVRAGAPHALVLAGPMGWHPQALLREIAVNGPGDIILTGPLPPGELDAVYRGAAAFAYPSVYEGFGLPVLEAMARGIPCVVSSTSSLPEVAGEAAVPVDPRSVVGLADALDRVLTDPDLAERLRIAGLARAARYSWDQTARLTLDVYKTLLSGP
jgi:glycosyltransferase involved in cell wall biosynthesis